MARPKIGLFRVINDRKLQPPSRETSVSVSGNMSKGIPPVYGQYSAFLGFAARANLPIPTAL